MNIPKVCIRGNSNPVEASRIIQFLERLGGVNKFNIDAKRDAAYYFIDFDGDIDYWDEVEQGYQLITLQKDCLLPESWCVNKRSHKAVEWLFNKYMEFTSCEYLGERNCIHHESREPWLVELTESQFLALTAPEKEEEKPFVWTDETALEFAKEYRFSSSRTSLQQFKQSKQRKPLFVTEDGVEVFEGDKYFFITNWVVYDCNAIKGAPSGYLKFSTRSAAENYIVENKSCVSYKDICGVWAMDAEAKRTLKQLIQSKLK